MWEIFPWRMSLKFPSARCNVKYCVIVLPALMHSIIPWLLRKILPWIFVSDVSYLMTVKAKLQWLDNFFEEWKIITFFSSGRIDEWEWAVRHIVCKVVFHVIRVPYQRKSCFFHWLKLQQCLQLTSSEAKKICQRLVQIVCTIHLCPL